MGEEELSEVEIWCVLWNPERDVVDATNQRVRGTEWRGIRLEAMAMCREENMVDRVRFLCYCDVDGESEWSHQWRETQQHVGET